MQTRTEIINCFFNFWTAFCNKNIYPLHWIEAIQYKIIISRDNKNFKAFYALVLKQPDARDQQIFGKYRLFVPIG